MKSPVVSVICISVLLSYIIDQYLTIIYIFDCTDEKKFEMMRIYYIILYYTL